MLSVKGVTGQDADGMDGLGHILVREYWHSSREVPADAL